MSLPTPFTIGVKRYADGAVDRHNNPTKTWLTAVDVEVYGIAPTSSDEPFEAGRNAVVTGLTVLAPVGTVIGPKDRVVIDSEEYEVDGEIADWSKGPFSWSPGIEIKLKRAEG
jgi:hypothetical protein